MKIGIDLDGVVIDSIKTFRAYEEIYDIFKHLDSETLNKIPQKFKDFVNNNKSKTYMPKFNHNKSLKELQIKEKTKEILSLIYLNFLCNNEEKIEYTKKIKQNQIKKEKNLREKYNPDNLFKKKRKSLN